MSVSPGATSPRAAEPEPGDRTLASPPVGRVRRLLGTWGKLAIALVIVVALVATGKLTFDPLIQTFERPWLLVTIFALHVAVMGIGVVRWWILMRRYAREGPGDRAPTPTPSLWQLYVYTWIGLFFGSIAPSVIAIDVVRYQYLRRQGITAEAILTSLLVDRMCGVVSLMALVMACSWTLVSASQLWAAVAVVVALAAIGLAVIAFGGRRLERLRVALRAAARARGTTLAAIAIGVVAHALKVVMFYVIVWGLDVPLSLGAVIEGAPAGYFVESIPITPSGLGTAHAAFDVLLAGGAAIFNVYFITKLLFGVAGGILWVTKKKPAANAVAERDAVP